MAKRKRCRPKTPSPFMLTLHYRFFFYFILMWQGPELMNGC